VSRRRGLVWGSVGLFVLVAATAAALLRPHPASASSQLSAALASTYDASGYVTSDSTDPDEITVVNAPNIYETVDNGVVTEISVGGHDYSVVPARCASRFKFVETQASGSFGILFEPSADEQISEAGRTFIATRDGQVVARYEVTDGRVVAVRRIFRLEGERPQGVTDSFTDIGHAPRIVTPSGSEVAISPTVYLNGCPL